MNILVVNDDGIESHGLHALAKQLKKLGDVWVVAPDRPQNAMGRAITLHKPLRLRQIGRRVFSVNGTPSDCVILGAGWALRDHEIHLLVSGINKGLNIGDDVTNSGTVAAALEGTIQGIPSIAVSLDGLKRFRFQAAASVTVEVAKLVLQDELPVDTFLNVNVPDVPVKDMKGIQVTSLSRRRYLNSIVEKIDPRGGWYCWVAGEQVTWNRRRCSDADAIAGNKVSLTPLHFDMTQYRALTRLRSWEPVLSRRMKQLKPS
ncbi:MAG: 5'/3'-nucleotidase SurE [Nitrospira sp.]|nr:5'/3'-nucleotidase SurE [Nitrospira sp.]